jgi:hypothetical protein
MICGIAGQPSLLPETQASLRGPLLTQAWRYRGPDGQVTWLADEGRVPLLHPRQAIQDLSLAGHQPMEWEGKSAPGSDRSSVATDPSAAGDELEQATANRRPKTDDRRQTTDDRRQTSDVRELRAEWEAEGVVCGTRTHPKFAKPTAPGPIAAASGSPLPDSVALRSRYQTRVLPRTRLDIPGWWINFRNSKVSLA